MELFLVDGLAPFCRGLPERRINWSKIPFSHWERDGRLDEAAFSVAIADFTRYCEAAARAGFNAITLDDLAHLALSPAYSRAVREYVESYRKAYAELIRIAEAAGLRVYLNSDVLFSPREEPAAAGRRKRPDWKAFRDLIADAFNAFPTLAGLILRIGEADGVDVRERFESRLAIRTPEHARELLREILPLFASMDRMLVFRTWSVGAHRIGDLIWNRDTFARVFDGFDDPHLVISMKYGESDFFRYLPLNKQIFRSQRKTIIELQARREYEGCGMFPSFIGDDYARFRQQLAEAGHVMGIMVWCQTGGWTRFRRLTWVEHSSIWNEINAWVTLRIFRDGASVPDAVRSWCEAHGLAGQHRAMLDILRASDEVVRTLLYTPEFADRKIFFRRLRVPPLINVYWDHIIVTHSMKRVMRCFVREGARAVHEGHEALHKIRLMKRWALDAGLPTQDLDFMYDTFEIVVAAREYYFLPFQPILCDRLRRLCNTYRNAWPVRYSVHLDFARARVSRRTLRLAFLLMLRNKRGYRILDRILTLGVLSRLYPLISRRARVLPSFAYENAMGVDAVFR